ncbi:hypothetical protein [Actinomadura sp. GTD37]|uniref:hypothetical protein n=1 Tax=Actinomadura sp. GTD37 TaxID=1778030 RepID=UPI0035C251AB
MLLTMPKPVEDIVNRQLCDLAKRGGEAIDVGLPPPGVPLDTVGVHYSFSLKEGVPGIAEYLVIADIREFYVTELLLVE